MDASVQINAVKTDEVLSAPTCRVAPDNPRLTTMCALHCRSGSGRRVLHQKWKLSTAFGKKIQETPEISLAYPDVLNGLHLLTILW